MTKEDFVTPQEFQKLYQKKMGREISIDSIWRWIRNQELGAIRKSPKAKQYLIPRKAIEEFFNNCEK